VAGRDPYRHSAALYDFTVKPLNIVLRRTRLELAPPRRGLKVLDVGCGTGADLELYIRAGCHVCGVDLSPAMLAAARKRLGAGADLRPGDAARLPFPDGCFDLVLATYLLHELPPAQRCAVLDEMIRVVHNRGRLLLTDFQPGPYRFPFGWLSRALIFLLEAGAGFQHLKNGLGFVRGGGLPALIMPRKLSLEAVQPAGGGAIAFFLLARRAKK
jgi:ubiquinone/menaquinone biosynthesis C-methylase UbiE